MALNSGLRSASQLFKSSQQLVSKSVNRGIHSTGAKRMGGDHGHGHGNGHGHDEPFYLHAKHMYNLDRMKNQKLQVPLAVIAAVGTGVAVPIFAVVYQQKKTASA